MQTVVFNKDNVKSECVTEIVRRVKVLLINSKNEVLLGYSHNEYQFPGGHVEDNELVIDAINREIKEETGIDLNVKDIEPFACINGYYKDFPNENCNRKTEIYYYKINTDDTPLLQNTSYTEHEQHGNFSLVFVPINNIEKVLKDNIKIYSDPHGITKEMLEIIKIYKSKYFF